MKEWVGRLFPAGTKSTEFLARYADVFTTVEGNTTFYALPSPDAVARWRSQVPPHFRFCFKFPRTVTHDRLLVDCAAEVNDFVARIAPLAELLGTLFLQLPPRFTDAGRLAHFLAALPRDFHYAVEKRSELELADLLEERGVDTVVMDTRGIHASRSPQFAAVRARKPAMPIDLRTTAAHPFIRFVPHETWSENVANATTWADQLAGWIAAGKRPYFFMHSPDDIDAPANAYAFHALLRARADVGELPVWPGTPRQRSLF
jgi:uncharacterized protein YecE (DUF72 family)